MSEKDVHNDSDSDIWGPDDMIGDGCAPESESSWNPGHGTAYPTEDPKHVNQCCPCAMVGCKSPLSWTIFLLSVPPLAFFLFVHGLLLLTQIVPDLSDDLRLTRKVSFPGKHPDRVDNLKYERAADGSLVTPILPLQFKYFEKVNKWMYLTQFCNVDADCKPDAAMGTTAATSSTTANPDTLPTCTAGQKATSKVPCLPVCAAGVTSSKSAPCAAAPAEANTGPAVGGNSQSSDVPTSQTPPPHAPAPPQFLDDESSKVPDAPGVNGAPGEQGVKLHSSSKEAAAVPTTTTSSSSSSTTNPAAVDAVSNNTIRSRRSSSHLQLGIGATPTISAVGAEQKILLEELQCYHHICIPAHTGKAAFQNVDEWPWEKQEHRHGKGTTTPEPASSIVGDTGGARSSSSSSFVQAFSSWWRGGPRNKMQGKNHHNHPRDRTSLRHAVSTSGIDSVVNGWNVFQENPDNDIWTKDYEPVPVSTSTTTPPEGTDSEFGVTGANDVGINVHSNMNQAWNKDIQGTPDHNFELQNTFQRGLWFSAILFASGNYEYMDQCQKKEGGSVVLVDKQSSMAVFQTQEDFSLFGVYGACATAQVGQVQYLKTWSRGKVKGGDPLMVRFFLRTPTNDSAKHNSCLQSVGLQKWGPGLSSTMDNRGGLLHFDLKFQCLKPAPYMTMLSSSAADIENVILVLLVIYAEIREFCSGGRCVWYERLAMQLLRVFIYFLLGGLSLGPVSRDTLSWMGVACFGYFWLLVVFHLSIATIVMKIRPTDNPCAGVISLWFDSEAQSIHKPVIRTDAAGKRYVETEGMRKAEMEKKDKAAEALREKFEKERENEDLRFNDEESLGSVNALPPGVDPLASLSKRSSVGSGSPAKRSGNATASGVGVFLQNRASSSTGRNSLGSDGLSKRASNNAASATPGGSSGVGITPGGRVTRAAAITPGNTSMGSDFTRSLPKQPSNRGSASFGLQSGSAQDDALPNYDSWQDRETSSPNQIGRDESSGGNWFSSFMGGGRADDNPNPPPGSADGSDIGFINDN